MAPLAVLAMLVLMVRDVRAVSGIYVNNHKIDKFETDRVKLIRPTDAQGYASKNGLLTKANFTNVQQYYQYLVGEDPVHYIDLLWGKNKTQLPSIFRVGSVSPTTYQFSTAAPSAIPASNLTTFTFNYADEQSPIKNTLNNTNLAYHGDYQRPQSAPTSVVTAHPVRQPVSTVRSPTNPTKKRRKKRPTYGAVSSTQQQPSRPVSDITKANLTPETLSLLSRYYSFSCTLTPIQPTPSAYPTSSTITPPTVSTTRRTKTRYLTSKPTAATTAKRPKPSTVPGGGVKQKKPVVYVDPPVIKRIGGMLESVYTFMENALTSTEYVEDSAEVRAAKQRNLANETTAPSSKVKRNTYTKAAFDEREYLGSTSGEVDSASRATFADTDQTWLPVAHDGTSKVTKQFTPKLVTISGLPSTLSTDGSKNKMTTKIQVTSEYTAATPPTVTLGKPRPDDDSADYDDSSEEESEEDYFDGFGAFEEVDDDDEDEEEEEEDDAEEEEEELYGGGGPVRPNRQTALTNDKDYEDVATHVERPVRIKRVKKRRRKKRPAVSYEDTAEYSEEDGSDEETLEDEYDDRDESHGEEDEDEDDEESGESTADAEGFFSRMFTTFGRFVRSLGFGAAARGTHDDYDEYDGGNARSTTPRVHGVRRRPTRSTSNDAGPATPDRPAVLSSGPRPAQWLGSAGSYPMNDIEENEQLVPPLEFPAVTEPSTSGTSAGWFDLMMPWDFFNPWSTDETSGDAAEQALPAGTVSTVTDVPQPVSQYPPTATSPGMSDWLSQWFGASTTSSPPSTTTLPKPDQLLSALAQYVAQTVSTRRPTEEELVHQTTKRPSRPVSYTSYQLWRIFVHTAEQLQRLEDYRQSPDGMRLQWWTSPSTVRPTDVLVPPGAPADTLRELLDEEGFRYEPTIRDVGQAIAYENPPMTRREQMELELRHGHPLTWYRYHRYGDIVKFAHYLQRRYPQHVQLLHIGRSYEGRPVTVVRVSFAPQRAKRSRKPAKKRPAVFVEAGAHGHQWVGPAVATWLLNRLLELPDTVQRNSTSSAEPADQSTMLAYDWYVLPVLNPDGYEYSHRRDRLWSKNRANQTQQTPSGVGQAILSSAINWWNAHKPQLTEHTSRPVESCYGVDLNRNWAYQWQQASDPIYREQCSDSYAGPEPFSEPESRALRDFLLTKRRNVRLYISLQAYGQLLTYPETESIATRDKERYGPEAYGDVHEMASAGLDAMRTEAGEFVYNLEPEAGPSTYGTASGYARHGAGIRYSYTLRLPDTGTHGLLLPPSSIVPIGRDLFELLRGMVEYS